MYPVANILAGHGGFTLTSHKTLRSQRANDVNTPPYARLARYVARLDSHTQNSSTGPMLLWPACWKTAWSVEETTIDGRVRVV